MDYCGRSGFRPPVFFLLEKGGILANASSHFVLLLSMLSVTDMEKLAPRKMGATALMILGVFLIA